MDIKSCMKRNVFYINPKTTIHEAAEILVKHHIGLLPVVDNEGIPIGVIGMRDLLKLELPDFVNFVADVDFVHDFGAVEDTRPPAKTLQKTIKSLMRPVITAEEDCGLLRAYALMLQQNLHDIPVVSKEGKLIGIASRVDVGSAILSAWGKAE
ncbi:MAG: CBS domain-containing protein [Anaerolineales bacterium]|nr:CBS domain-containing protein [Anaerolineales bacterium]MCB9111083.1 CBS domain-containing protein [Anaerolineales bacterium]